MPNSLVLRAEPPCGVSLCPWQVLISKSHGQLLKDALTASPTGVFLALDWSGDPQVLTAGLSIDLPSAALPTYFSVALPPATSGSTRQPLTVAVTLRGTASAIRTRASSPSPPPTLPG
jgi:hypothetical protein